MDVSDLLLELYGRVPPLVADAVDGLGPEDLARSPAPGINSIGWLTWHLARVQDHHVAELLGEDQIWVRGDHAGRFGLEPDPDDIGYGHTPEQMRSVRPDGPDAVTGYLTVVDERVRGLLATVGSDDLARIIDRRWDPPVTLGVRLVSVADDSLQHAGQAAYLRGLLGL